jgi:hypothetical protein
MRNVLAGMEPGLRRRRFLPFLPLLLIAFHQQALPMSLFNPLRTCVFSAVQARLTKNGVPLKGATVIRRWEWHKLQEESTQTDDDGNFKFPAVFEWSFARLLPIETVIGQALYVKAGSEETKFWVNSKRDGEINGEYDGLPTLLTCELTSEMKIYHRDGASMHTLCSRGP